MNNFIIIIFSLEACKYSHLFMVSHFFYNIKGHTRLQFAFISGEVLHVCTDVK